MQELQVANQTAAGQHVKIAPHSISQNALQDMPCEVAQVHALLSLHLESCMHMVQTDTWSKYPMHVVCTVALIKPSKHSHLARIHRSLFCLACALSA